jgi:pullulanase
MHRTTASQLARLPWAWLPRVAMAALLAACATADTPGDEVDAGVKDPLPPDASPPNEPFTTPIYLRGSFNDFGLSSPFTHEGDNRYTAVVSLGVGSHELKVADEEFSADTTFAVAADRATAIELDTPTALVQTSAVGNNILFFVPQTGAYRFELSATDRTSPVLLVSLDSAAPFRDILYLRGSFNEFDTSMPLPYAGRNRYTATFELPAGTHRFKIADQEFSDSTTFSMSATEALPLLLDTPTTLVPASGTENDTVLELTQSGTYLFDFIASNLEAPVLQVALVPGALSIDTERHAPPLPTLPGVVGP